MHTPLVQVIRVLLLIQHHLHHLWCPVAVFSMRHMRWAVFGLFFLCSLNVNFYSRFFQLLLGPQVLLWALEGRCLPVRWGGGQVEKNYYPQRKTKV